MVFPFHLVLLDVLIYVETQEVELTMTMQCWMSCSLRLFEGNDLFNYCSRRDVVHRLKVYSHKLFYREIMLNTS